MDKTCHVCGLVKPATEFRKKHKECVSCHSQYLKDYRARNKEELKRKRLAAYQANPEKFRLANKKSYANNKEVRKEARKEYREAYYANHRDELISYAKDYRDLHNEDLLAQKKVYYQENKKEIIAQKIVYQRNRYRNDPFYRLRSLVGRVINRMLNSRGSSKNGGSIRDYLPYTVQELKEHLEKQFESWMTWENQGRYNPNIWDDNDPTTWTWQIDHIVPQTSLLYSSMQDENFVKCWSLSNLRPLSSKQNLLDGSKRARHK